MSGTRSEETLFSAALESASIFNGVAAECAVRSGLLRMPDFTTAETLMARMGFHPSKATAFKALLKVLVREELLELRDVAGVTVYRTRGVTLTRRRSLDGGIVRHEARNEALSPWFGDDHVELIRSSNREFLGDDLHFFREPQLQIKFNNEFLGAWQKNLRNPLYEFGRLAAVRELVTRGRRFLDLCCGPGFGAERLAQYSPEGCEIVGVDRSLDFLREARRLVYPGARVQFIYRDLNEGLPPLPAGAFDGVLFNGAFHFIKDKAARLREMHRVMRPGGLLVIGHCFSRSDFADEAMHDLYFSMVENASWPEPWERIRSLVTDHGFVETKTMHRGSHSYVFAERLDVELPPNAL